MSVDVINISGRRIKKLILNVYNRTNGSKLNADLDKFVLEPVGDDKVLLQDPITKRGVLFSKINIATLFPNNIDISPFKNRLVYSRQPMSVNDVECFNEKHGETIVSGEMDILKSPTGFPIDDVRDFVLFCRVFGFYELDVGDVTLIRSGDILYISVNETHPVYYGVLEVKV
ncbi:hypothetical protein D5W64_12980 [Salmonella enterica subsp. enterica serovar Saintpaul]|nr:hypothetical protein [Salmonella enterica subsp. enterica serovar Saintpaul]